MCIGPLPLFQHLTSTDALLLGHKILLLHPGSFIPAVARYLHYAGLFLKEYIFIDFNELILSTYYCPDLIAGLANSNCVIV